MLKAEPGDELMDWMGYGRKKGFEDDFTVRGLSPGRLKLLLTHEGNSQVQESS